MLDSLSQLRKLSLRHNHLDCADCSVPGAQHWLRQIESRHAPNLTAPLLCASPVNLRNTKLSDVPFDEDVCVDPRHKLWLALGLPLALTASLLVALGSLAFRFRCEFAYLLHLVHIRRNSKKANEAYDKCLYDAFICYSGKNRKWVLDRLAPGLESGIERFRVCLHDRDFSLGSHIVNNIVESIEQSRKVIVVLTKHFVKSKWCQWELEMANHKLFSEDREFLVLIQLEPLDRDSLPRVLRFLMDTRTFLEWPQPETKRQVNEAFARLRRALGPSLFQRTSERAPLLQQGDSSVS